MRDGNLDEFFEHENQAYPPALSQNGAIRATKKADLVACLEDLVPFQERTIHPSVQATIFDGSAIVNMLRPGAAKTFLDYARQVFLPYIVSQLQHVERIDVIWDQYFTDSLKLETRKKRGKGVRRRVEASTAIPGNWQEFLRIDENKTELFAFLATILTSTTSKNDKVIISTYKSDVLCNHTRVHRIIKTCPLYP